ncbi:MAG TPA: hypothetical protein IAD07_04280 [Candidatus Fimivicinus intestinavium]|nr:hypothetical protein [Candidatus Fimivicinus intestinavium]
MDGPTIRLMPGERRQQRVRIYGCDPSATVVVQSASWEMHRVSGDVVSQGACVITDNNLLTFMLAVDDPGRYHLLITAMIGPEIYKTAAGVIAYDCC